MTKIKLRSDEILTIIEYFEDFMMALITERELDSIGSAVELARKRDLLQAHLMEMFGEKE